jgi:hypothetical protein
VVLLKSSEAPLQIILQGEHMKTFTKQELPLLQHSLVVSKHYTQRLIEETKISLQQQLTYSEVEKKLDYIEHYRKELIEIQKLIDKACE